jgi:short-subunit dehydrogenase
MTDLHSTLIIGAAGDIGRKAARILLERGFSVTLATRNEAQLHAALRELCFHGTVNSLVIDLHDRPAVARLASRIATGSDPVRHLFFATGTGHRVPASGPVVTHDRRNRTLNHSLVALTRAAALNMQARTGGSIVDLGAIRTGQSGEPAMPATCCSEAPQGLALELAPRLAEQGIRILAVTPVNEAVQVPDCLLNGCAVPAGASLRCTS